MNKKYILKYHLKKTFFWNFIKTKLIETDLVTGSILFNDIIYSTSSRLPDLHAEYKIVLLIKTNLEFHE